VIAVVDFGRGNLLSIAQALRHCGAGEVEITDDAEAVLAAERIVLPGVGAFADAMRALQARGLVAALRQAAARGTPMLGICLGMQLFADESEEFGRHDGLGLVAGAVRRLPAGNGPGAIRIPNVGWRALEVRRPDPIAAGLAEGAMMYFVHSYAHAPADAGDVVATIAVNGVQVAAMVRKGGLIGCQFHPEKSGETGLAVIRNFVALDRS